MTLDPIVTSVNVIISGGFSLAHREALPEFERTTGIAVATASAASQGTGFVPAGDQVAVARSMASTIAANARLVVGMLKDMALKTMPRGPVEQMYLTQQAIDRVRQSEDAKEGPLSFREKRKPNFRGR